MNKKTTKIDDKEYSEEEFNRLFLERLDRADPLGGPSTNVRDHLAARVREWPFGYWCTKRRSK